MSSSSYCSSEMAAQNEQGDLSSAWGRIRSLAAVASSAIGALMEDQKKVNALLLSMAVVIVLLLLFQMKGGGEGGEDHPIRPAVPEPWDLELPGEVGEEAPCTVRSVGSECLYPQDFYEETNRVHNDTKTFYACRKWCHKNHRREGESKPSLCGELVYDFKNAKCKLHQESHCSKTGGGGGGEDGAHLLAVSSSCGVSPLCGLEGTRCLGPVVGIATGVRTEGNCVAECGMHNYRVRANGIGGWCEWFSYHEPSGDCHLLVSCPSVSKSEPGWTSGENRCEGTPFYDGGGGGQGEK